MHFKRNVLAYVAHKDKRAFAGKLKQIWLAPDETTAGKRANALAEEYGKRFPKAIATLEDGLEDSLAFFSFPKLDSRKISSTKMLERLSKKIRRRTRVVGIFPNPDSYLRLVKTYLMECAEDWSASRAYQSPIHGNTASERCLISSSESRICELLLTVPTGILKEQECIF